jgi:hypothetical protein
MPFGFQFRFQDFDVDIAQILQNEMPFKDTSTMRNKSFKNQKVSLHTKLIQFKFCRTYQQKLFQNT